MTWEDRIEINPHILVGKPVIRGTRLSVEFIVELLANGWSEPQVFPMKTFPHVCITQQRCSSRNESI